MGKLLNNNLSGDKSIPVETTLDKLGSASDAGDGASRLIDSIKLAISTPAGWFTYPSITPYPRTSAGIKASIAAAKTLTESVTLMLEAADYAITEDMEFDQHVAYIGVKPVITYDGDVPDDGVTVSGGTRFVLSDGVTALHWNKSGLASEPENLTSTICDGVTMYGITFVGGKRAIHTGSPNMMGFVNSRFDELYGINQTGDFSFIFDNFQHCVFRKIWSSNTLQSGGGVRFGNSLSPTLLPGNSTIEDEIYTYSKHILNRSIEFVCDYARTGAVLNEIKVSGRLQGNRYGSATPTSISLSTTASSSSIVVSDATQFSYMQVGMPVAFATTGGGFTANVVYFVLTRNENTNTITLGEGHFTSSPIVPTATGAYTALCSGWPALSIKATSGNAISNSDFGHCDLEAYGNVCALYIANASGKLHIGEIMTSYTKTAIARRYASLGVTYAGSSSVTEDLSGSFNPSGSCKNLAGSPTPYTGGSFTLNSSHNGMKYRYQGTAAITISVPTGLPKGFEFEIVNDSTGSITFSAPSGGAIRSVGSVLTTSTQFAKASLCNIANSVYHLAFS